MKRSLFHKLVLITEITYSLVEGNYFACVAWWRCLFSELKAANFEEDYNSVEKEFKEMHKKFLKLKYGKDVF